MKKNQAQMAMSIVEAVNSLFNEESELKRYEWKNIDLTQFFTAYIIAGSYIFNKITDGDKNNLEFTHLANQLVVQDLLNKEE